MARIKDDEGIDILSGEGTDVWPTVVGAVQIFASKHIDIEAIGQGDLYFGNNGSATGDLAIETTGALNITGASPYGVAIHAYTGPIALNTDQFLGLNAKEIRIKDGANASLGKATLSNGAVSITCNNVRSDSNIFLVHQKVIGTPGVLYPNAVIAGQGFSIKSAANTDNSIVSYLIINPA